jgi:hypothetical protein
MLPGQWFSLWLTMLSVLGGGVVALLSVWLGASLALRGNRRSMQHQRALLAAERCLAAVDGASEDYHRIMVMLSFAMEHIDTSKLTEDLCDTYDHFVNSDIGHEAWLLENRDATLSIADCLHLSMRLHVDSFSIEPEDIRVRVADLSERLREAGDQLRAAFLDKGVSELTDRDRYAIAALLPGRHTKKSPTTGSTHGAGS